MKEKESHRMVMLDFGKVPKDPEIYEWEIMKTGGSGIREQISSTERSVAQSAKLTSHQLHTGSLGSRMFSSAINQYQKAWMEEMEKMLWFETTKSRFKPVLNANTRTI